MRGSLGNGLGVLVTYQRSSTLIFFLAFHHGTMDVRDHTCNVLLVTFEPGNDGVRVYRKFGLGAPGQRQSNKNNGTNVEDMQHPGELRSPSRDFLLIVPCVEMSRNRVSLFMFDDPPLDLRHSTESKHHRRGT